MHMRSNTISNRRASAAMISYRRRISSVPLQ
jgi:hypothetical protein